MSQSNYKHLFLFIGFGFINCFQLTAGEPTTTTMPNADVLQALMTRLKTLQEDFLLEMDKFIQKQQALHKKLIECEKTLAAQFKIILDLKAKETPIEGADKEALSSAKKTIRTNFIALKQIELGLEHEIAALYNLSTNPKFPEFQKCQIKIMQFLKAQTTTNVAENDPLKEIHENFLQKTRNKEAWIKFIHGIFQQRLNRLSRQRFEAMLTATRIFEGPASSLVASLPPSPGPHQPTFSTVPPTTPPSRAAINRPTSSVVAAAPKQTNLWPWIFGIGAGISFFGGVAGVGYKLWQHYKTKQKRRRKALVKPVKRK